MDISRKAFLQVSLAAAASAVGAAACGDDTSEDGGDTGTGSNGVTSCAGEISGNHGHTITVTAADVEAAAEKTYSIKGASGHDHAVTVSAANFATLAGGAPITVTSIVTDSHTHDITVTCA